MKKSDASLVLEFQSGNTAALAILVKRWHKVFCEKAFWVVKDADVSKDIAQDSWRTIIDQLHTLKNPSSFKSWALRIVYTKSIDAFRQQNKRRKDLQTLYYEDTAVNHLDDGDNDKQNTKLRLLKAIKTLPQKQQIVLDLFYTQGYALKEISSILDISVGTAKSRLFHARETLKKTLKFK
ncbi:RNA polymerase sigma factor [Psychroserpens sp.]|uniref:RNA polymerase sigma factor n=1 Tax=Psychroserpens sp. TaxID=2020870 RepID=UPI003C732879